MQTKIDKKIINTNFTINRLLETRDYINLLLLIIT